jgi:CHAD domain-containing protein
MTEPENLVLHELRAVRREFAAVLENQETFSRQQVRLFNALQEMSRHLGDIRTDVILLENHNISRHGEILAILRRLDMTEEDA